MLVLIVGDDHLRQAELAVAFAQAGFQTASTDNQAYADRFIRKGLVDLLIIDERVGHRLTHSLALLAEYKNPAVETILLTPRCDRDIEELFLLIPSLHCLVAPDISPPLITKLAISAFTGLENHSGAPIGTEDKVVDSVDVMPSVSAACSQGQRGELLLETA